MPETSSPRVALFLYSLDGGGAERVMANLANRFVQQGLVVDLVLVRKQGPYLKIRDPAVRVIELKASRTPARLPDLITYLRQKTPFALLSTMHYANEVALGAKKLSGTATRVVVCEQNNVSTYARLTSRKAEKWTPLWTKLFYRWADAIVAASQGVAADLHRLTGLPDHKMHVIYNPVVTPDLFKQAKEPVDHPWFAPEEPPVVLSVGRLVGQKDFATLIRAFAQVRQVRPVRLMILGSNAGSKTALEALVQELGLTDDVLRPGFVHNPYAYMARASVFVLSSQWEGFGNVLVEALAAGTPVVSTHCESGPAEILAEGKYGELVPVENDQAMAAAIL